MYKLIICTLFTILLCSINSFAQHPTNLQPSSANTKSDNKIDPKNGFAGFTVGNIKRDRANRISPLADDDNGPFILPQNSLIKLQRQVEFYLLPPNFFPAIEPETDPERRKSIRYALAYYRDSEVPIFREFRDLIIGLRFDTRDGKLEVRYFNNYFIIDPFQAQFIEDNQGFSASPLFDGTVYLYFIQSNQQLIASITGLFTDNPRNTAIISVNDFDGLSTDADTGNVGLFFRKGTSSSDLTMLLADPSLENAQRFDLLSTINADAQAYILKVLSNNKTLSFRAASVLAR